jgi:hypothetical protein
MPLDSGGFQWAYSYRRTAAAFVNTHSMFFLKRSIRSANHPAMKLAPLRRRLTSVNDPYNLTDDSKDKSAYGLGKAPV